jgi:hypothetical protein
MQNPSFSKRRLVLAIAAVGAATLANAGDSGRDDDNKGDGRGSSGTYVAGDFHNHTTCSDGTISMQKLVKKATDKVDTPWGLDWFVQAGHGGNGNRNCTLVEDATLSTPAYPFVSGQGPNTTWAGSIGAANVKGNTGSADGSSTTALSSQANPSMWRWQSIQELQYPVMEYLSALKDVPLFIGMESVVAGHEHSSMSVITGQMPAGFDRTTLPSQPPFVALGNATALAQWSYCFDRADTDNSRGGDTASATGNNWDCANPASPASYSADLGWKDNAKKLFQPAGAGTGDKGHLKTVEAVKWMDEFHTDASYYVPAHLERAGPFNPNGNNGWNVEHLRDFNNAAPNVAFGMETQPGHGASDARGEYTVRRNNFGTSASPLRVDSVGGTTFGGTGVYGAQVGGVWDALLGEGRDFWFFASSDWHNRGTFGPDDRRSTQDFFPGEYQRNYTLVHPDDRRRKGQDLTPQAIVDGLRTGNNFASSGQLIDRLAFVACVAPKSGLGDAALRLVALNAALKNTDVDIPGCATMGEKLVVAPGKDVVVAIVVRDPEGTNYSPYTFPNPSLMQIGVNQALNKPVLDHIDVINGLVTGRKIPGTPDYSGAWPSDWVTIDSAGNVTVKESLASVPAAAKNDSAEVIKTFNGATWTAVKLAPGYKAMTFRISDVGTSQYLRLRGTNLPASVPYETDASGNPLPDIYTNAAAVSSVTGTGTAATEFPAGKFLKIPCTTVGTTEFDGCPSHLQAVSGQKYSSFDVAAWSDLWFYSNPIYIEVAGSAPCGRGDDQDKQIASIQ